MMNFMMTFTMTGMMAGMLMAGMMAVMMIAVPPRVPALAANMIAVSIVHAKRANRIDVSEHRAAEDGELGTT